MSIRSYLRGAGLGILVAALTLTFGGGNKTKAMTDAEVRERAKELGMTGGNEVLTEAYTMAAAPEIIEASEAATGTMVISEPVSEVSSEAASETVSAAEAATEETATEEEASQPAPE